MDTIQHSGEAAGGMDSRLPTRVNIFNITHHWSPTLIVGCSHAKYADPAAIDAVLRFRDRFRPTIVAHLGDFCDLSAFMRSNVKTGDGDEVDPDIDGGIAFLKQLRPTIVLAGNHEDRLWRLQNDQNNIVSSLAHRCVVDIQKAVNDLGAVFVPYAGHYQQYKLGNFKLMHGTIFSENACRDEAETHGNCVCAHTHRTGVSPGRRDDHPKCFNVGTLTRRAAFEYSKTRRSELSWSQGFVYGYTSDTRCQFWLHEQDRNSTDWVLPI